MDTLTSQKEPVGYVILDLRTAQQKPAVSKEMFCFVTVTNLYHVMYLLGNKTKWMMILFIVYCFQYYIGFTMHLPSMFFLLF